MRRTRLAALGALVAAVTLVTTLSIQGVLAGSGQPGGSVPRAGRGSVSTVSGKGITAVKILRSTGGVVDGTLTGTWETLPGATTSMTVPSGTHAVIEARFTAESLCYGASGGNSWWCALRIVIGGSAGKPNGDYAFDSVDNGNATDGNWGGHAVDRSSNVLGPGSYPVTVQYASGFGTPTFWLDDWSLTVTRIKR